MARRYGVPGKKGYISVKKFREALKSKPPTPATPDQPLRQSGRTTLQTQEKNELPSSLRVCRWGKEKLGLKIRQKILERTKGDQYQQMFFMFRYVHMVFIL